MTLTNVDDGNTEFYRGGKWYYRACGWNRFASKVRGKYEDDKWLGEPGYRRDSSEGEWPLIQIQDKASQPDKQVKNYVHEIVQIHVYTF